MLIEFSVQNFRSLRERQTLSLVASSSSEHREHNTWAVAGTKLRGLRTAVLYGANASGKSNVLRALLTLQQIAVHSAQGQAGVELPADPFRLDPESASAPTEFEIHFMARDEVRYQYRCAVSTTRVHSESLVVYPRGRPQEWFSRALSRDRESYTWEFGRNFKSEGAERKVWQEFTRPNALFLSTAVQLNNEQLKPAFEWMAQGLIVVAHRTGFNPFLSLDLMRSIEGQRAAERFLSAADVGIERIELRESEAAVAAPRRSVLGEPQFELRFKDAQGGEIGGPAKRLEIMTWHRRSDGQEVPFTMEEESDGTQKLFELTGGWLRGLQSGATVVVDELDRSLHPHVTRFLIELFQSAGNTQNAQLVFTTHDTTLLDPSLLRRDQVWFVEKDAQKATRLYPLLDFSPRKDEALERGYLKGRYGAIPFIGSLHFGDP